MYHLGMEYNWAFNQIRTVPIGESIGPSPIILAEIRLHGTPARNVRKIHFEIISENPRQRIMRAYSNRHKPVINPDGKIIGLEIRCTATPDMIAQSRESIRTGAPFKMYMPKEGILVYMDENLMERMNANNKKMGLNALPESLDTRAMLSKFDIKNSVATMEVIFV